MRFLDRLELDYQAVFNGEESPIDKGFEEGFKKLVLL